MIEKDEERGFVSLSGKDSGNFRPFRVVVPFKLNGAKSRLAPALDPEERRLLAFAMIRDVLRTVSEFGEVTVLSRPGLNAEDIAITERDVEATVDGSKIAGRDIKFTGKDIEFTGTDIKTIGKDILATGNDIEATGTDAKDHRKDIEILESDLDLNDALNELIEREARGGWQKDILIVMADLALLLKSDIAGILNCPGDVVLCPGRGGGTNMILINNPAFRTCYSGRSFPKHLAFARDLNLEASVFESFRASTDIDQPEDLIELLLHGRGEGRALLERMGFSISDEARSLAAGNAPVRLHRDP